jgi:hypothetical protein
MQKYLILFFFLVLPLVIMADSPRKYRDVYFTNASSCLDYQGYERGGSGMILHFRNRCDFNVFALACVTYPNGSKEIKKSGSRIPYGGSWSTTFFEGSRAQSIDWVASVSSARLPASCS